MSMLQISEVLQTGQKAWEAFSRGWASGAWEEYRLMLSQDIEFSFPVGPFRGKYTGKEGYEKMIAKIESDSKTGYRLLFTVTHISSNNNTVVVEYEAVGNFDGYPYRSNNAIAFSFLDEKISAYREYFGDLDFDMFDHFAKLADNQFK